MQGQHGTGRAEPNDGLIHLPNAVEAGWAFVVQQAHGCRGYAPEQACSEKAVR